MEGNPNLLILGDISIQTLRVNIHITLIALNVILKILVGV
jgi:hypothetical protein